MTGGNRPGEFELIARYFAPLAAANEGALGLMDDAALIGCRPGHRLVATVDALVAGVHFLARDPADLIARKLLRVNLSDLAAMGAEPSCYLLAISLPDDLDEEWFAAFASGLAADQAEYGVKLAGGDTTSAPGALSLCLTALGEVPDGAEIRRAGATPGQDIYVSGTIGDAALAVRGLEERGGVLAARCGSSAPPPPFAGARASAPPAAPHIAPPSMSERAMGKPSRRRNRRLTMSCSSQG